MASTYQRPGVYVNEALTAINTANGTTAAAAGAFLGAGSRGPVKPTKVSNWNDFTARFGTFTDSTYLAQALFAYFSNGGSDAYVARVVGTGGVVATQTLHDTAATPLPTLKLDASSVGIWGNSIYIDVIAGYTAGRFDVVVKYGSASASSTFETFADLSMASTDTRYAVSVINSLSKYVVATDLNSTTAAPNNAPGPQTGTALASGADAAAPAAADYQSALNQLTSIDQPLVLNLPGVTDTTTVNDAISFAQTQEDVFVVVDPPSGDTVSGVTTYAAGLTVSSYAAIYYPWLKVQDPTKATGVLKTVPPGGAVVGQYISTDAKAGPYKTPAGVANVVANVLDLETTLQASDYDTLNTSNPPVNAIKPVPGFGICLFGGRTLKGGTSDKYIAIRRSLIYIEKALKDLTAYAVFQPNDTRLWNGITSRVEKWLRNYAAQGGLAGGDTGFYVICDSSNNDPTSQQNGIVNIEVGVALEYPAEFIVIRIGQTQSGASVSASV